MKPYLKNRLWIILIATVLVFVYKINFSAQLGRMFSVSLPIISAFLLGWFLVPLKTRFEEFITHSKRKWLLKYAGTISAFSIYLLFVGLILFFIIYLIPILKDGILNVSDKLMEYYSVIEKYMDKEHLSTLINPSIYLKGAKDTFSMVYNMAMTFVVLIYVLLEHRRLKAFFVNLLSVVLGNDKSERLIYYFSKVNRIFTEYFYSRIISSLVLGILVTAGFLVMGMKHPVFFGITVAVSNLIPIFGAFISGIPIALTALTEYGLTKAIIALGIIVAGQQIENNILTPKIVGNSIGLSGFWILFAIIVGGGLFGFWGLLVCIPVTATLKMFYNEFLKSKTADY